jgi:predicted NBD/HSP70 family sugar kinase
VRPVAACTELADIRSGPEAVLRRLNEILTGFNADGVYERLTALGIGLPGPVKFPDGVPVSPPTMPGWDRYPVREVLSREHRCPAAVDSDATVMGIGERHGGVAQLIDDLLFLKIGTGISCGIHVAGRVYRGSDGYAGNIGHIQVDTHGPVCACGNVGCLDAVFSGAALTRDAAAAAREGGSPVLVERLVATNAVTVRDVADGAAGGDAACIRLIRDGARWIGSVLAGLVTFITRR